MNTTHLRIATRQSPLALWQANHIAEQLKTHWPDLTITLVPRVTTGDKFLKDKLQTLGGKGLFVKELEEALLNQDADLAVHSTKDIPAELAPELILSTICQRDNPFDAFLSPSQQPLSQLSLHARIGTVSLRRKAQLLALRPDFDIVPLRGNIQTRIQKMHDEPLDGIILATSGIERMNLAHLITEHLMPPMMLPACGQGALSIECRASDQRTQQLLAPLHHEPTARCVTAERLLNAILGGNCHVPLAVYAEINDEQMYLQAKVMSEDGQEILSFKGHTHIASAESLAHQAADALLKQGADRLLGL